MSLPLSSLSFARQLILRQKGWGGTRRASLLPNSARERPWLALADRACNCKFVSTGCSGDSQTNLTRKDLELTLTSGILLGKVSNHSSRQNSATPSTLIH